MFSFHKPKTYRSLLGCCICGAKSSSSRFTDSSRYEIDFERCFKIQEERSGDICNACVLLVKRCKKLPPDSNRNWNHVVDAKSGPGSKNNRSKTTKTKLEVEVFKKIRKKKKVVKPQPVNEIVENFDLFVGSTRSNENNGYLNKGIRTRSMVTPSPSPSNSSLEFADEEMAEKANVRPRRSSFIDLNYWTETKVCCGIVFKGRNGELMIDAALYKPCNGCDRKKNVSPPTLEQEVSNDTVYSSQSKDSLAYFQQTSHEHTFENQPPTPTSPIDLRMNKDSYEVCQVAVASTLDSL